MPDRERTLPRVAPPVREPCWDQWPKVNQLTFT
jgi:hypothetical protein